ncbi:hypothetical protein BDW42DRAFT_189991 [Aspergillus taichungensis]|uniref:Amine oxidase domain-containing protein n=1 Tax=Aspergillus taichungensis TaxID=482145 RepID=A0A2J5I9L2_9EURO|nr:hypothetical protein BDW42DRAFT_189991 [Aspergillus taichungensis]
MRLLPTLAVWGYSCILTASATLNRDHSASHGHRNEIRTRDVDVAIIGGGAAGTYAAIRLQQLNYSVVLVEPKDQLGGHTKTYTDAASGLPVDVGVHRYSNISIVRDYFRELGLDWETGDESEDGGGGGRFGNAGSIIDLRTGENLDSSSTLDVDDDDEAQSARNRYLALLRRYEPYLDMGFRLPHPVPEELLRPMSDFIARHRLEAMVDPINEFNQDMGNWQQMPALYSLKYANRDALTAGMTQPRGRNNSAIYDAARKQLGGDVLLQSRVKSVSRDGRGDVRMVVARTTSPRELRKPAVVEQEEELVHVRARRILITAPPTLPILSPFLDLDEREEALFAQWQWTGLWPASVRIQGVDASIMNKRADARYGALELPAICVITQRGPPDTVVVHYVSDEPMLREEDVRHGIVTELRQLRKAGFDVSEPEIITLADHSPYELRVSPRAIADGFYSHLNALQGYRKTFWTGAALQTHDSAQIWRFTEALIQGQVVKSLA